VRIDQAQVRAGFNHQDKMPACFVALENWETDWGKKDGKPLSIENGHLGEIDFQATLPDSCAVGTTIPIFTEYKGRADGGGDVNGGDQVILKVEKGP